MYKKYMNIPLEIKKPISIYFYGEKITPTVTDKPLIKKNESQTNNKRST